MKQHTQRFKEAITELGKQQSVLITYISNGEQVVLGVEQINSATPRYDADLLKSVMKELHLDSNVDIPVGTEINFKYGLLVDGEFEYLNYGNYIVYSSEKKEDTSSYEILCYDKMIYSMKEYEELAIFYPCTVRSYINAIAGKLGLDFANKNDTFVNYDKELVGDFYLSTDEETQEKKSMGYTYRDILDDLAEVTASVICINDKDELEVRYITDSINYETTEKSKELKVESEIESQIKILELDGKSTQETRSGKNLLNIANNTYSYLGITAVIENGKITLNGTAEGTSFINIPFNFILDNTYTLSANNNVANSNIGIRFEGATAYNDTYFTFNEINSSKSFTLANATTRNFVVRIATGTTLSNFVIYPQLEIGESATEWEQHGASPSPEFPSEIKSLGDDVNLFNKGNADVKSFYISPTEISANDTNKYIIMPCKPNTYYSISKINSSIFIVNGTTNYPEINNTDIKNRVVSSSNILESYLTTADTNYLCIRFKDSSDTLTEQEILNSIKVQKGTVATAYSEYGKGTVEIKQSGKNLINPETSVNGYISSTGSFVANVYNKCSDYIRVTNITYSFSAYDINNERILYSYQIAYFDEEKNFISRQSIEYNIPFTINDTTIKYIRIWQSVISANNDAKPDLLQLEVGETVTEYEAYKGNNYAIPLSQPLRSLPNGVKDTIEEDGIHRRVGSVVLDGSDDENYNYWVEKEDYISFYSTKLINTNKNSIISNYFPTTWYGEFLKNGIAINEANQLFMITIEKTKLTTLDVLGLRNWISTHNTEVIYELAEEVIEPFNEEQQAVIDNIQTFNGVNIISSNAELQIRYAIDQDTIDKEYLKDTNVNFGEVFGPVNAVVLSRSTSDNIYRNDVASINENGLYEIKISDNQILNQNNRDTFIQPIFDKLKGLTYGICDFNSTGIMYYDLLDRFNVKVGDNIYSTVMFHNEQNITQGLEENIYVEKPKTSETDYTKADKTDRKINQTNLIVDKQQQNITALITSNSDLVKKTAQLIIDVDKIEGEISEVADVTTTGEGYGTVELENINGDSEPIYIRVYPTNEDIISLKPKVGLYPSVGLYPHSREIHFKNTSSQEPYEVTCNIPSDLYQLNDIHDEFILKYETQECYVIHRIGINENGEKYLLETETIESFDYPVVPLTEGDYQIYTPLSNMAYIYVRLMVQNIYTTQFATKVEVNSKIEQTSNSIISSVNQTLTNYDTKTEVNSKISQTANEINSEVRKKVGEDEIISKINQTAETVGISANKIELSANDVLNLLAGNTINLSSKNIVISSDFLEITKYGKMKLKGDVQATDLLRIENINGNDFTYFAPDSWGIVRGNGSIYATAQGGNFANSNIELSGTGGTTNVRNTGISTPVLTQTSKEENKKNFEKLENALNIIKDIDIYKYNLKAEKDGTKKHIGFVIGNDYNYSEEVTSTANDGADIYGLSSVCLQAIKEQQEIIETLQEEIKKLKEEK